MYAIREGAQKVNGKMVPTFEREIMEEETHLVVEAGANSIRNSCACKAGSRAYLSILSLSGDFDFVPITDGGGFISGVEISCSGEESLKALLKALEFTRRAISEQRCEYRD
jgi:hypothetical protein